jgi:hypothetical protein
VRPNCLEQFDKLGIGDCFEQFDKLGIGASGGRKIPRSRKKIARSNNSGAWIPMAQGNRPLSFAAARGISKLSSGGWERLNVERRFSNTGSEGATYDLGNNADGFSDALYCACKTGTAKLSGATQGLPEP